MNSSSRTILIAIIFLCFVASGCKDSSSSADEASSVEPQTLLSAEALSNHYVALAFEGPPSANLEDPSNYEIVDEFGTTLQVTDGFIDESGSQIILTTTAQQENNYTLTLKSEDSKLASQSVSAFFVSYANAAANNSVQFKGSLRPEPALLTAISLSNTQVLLTFSDDMSTSVETIEFYRIVAADDSTPEVDVGGLTVLQATLGSDTSTVILTTSSQDNIQYRVKVTNVWSSPEKKRIDPNYTIQNFFGIDPIDTTPPVVKGVETTGPTTIVLTFNEAVSDNAGDPSNYTVYYCQVAESPCQEQNRVQLAITDAVLNQYNTQVLLTTLPQEVGVEYFVVVEGVQDPKGNVVDTTNTANTVTTIYAGESDPATVLELPRLIGANSTSNTTVVVSFSKPMSSSVEDPGNYFIVQENVNSEAGTLSIVSAKYLSNDRNSVLLQTRSQNELTYRITAVNVKDTYGQELDNSFTAGGFLSANTALFAGTPTDNQSLLDSDSDGLTDNDELSGYEVEYITLTGDKVRKQVTSSPDLFDTDGDGISDFEERSYGSDPRNRDTDYDDLSDYQELNEIYTDPFNQDSDGDGLTDGVEFNSFSTSPLFADTDGDQLDDFYEITVNRNPRISDLPQLDIEVGNINLQLDYRFDVTKEGSTTRGETESVSTTLTQTRSSEYSKSDSSSHSFDVKLGFQQELGFKATSLVPEWKLSLSQELSTNNSWTSSVSRTSSEASTREYAKSLETNQEVVRGETVTRVVESASISVPIYIKSTNDIAFTVTNIIVTALVPNEGDPAVLIPIATLVPAADASLSFSLGPLIPARGPIEFKEDTIYPSVVESLMANPRGVIFKVANYEIQDENGRRYAFTSQEVAERTAPLIFDFGGVDLDGDGLSDNPERYRVAVNYGFDVTQDKRVIFDSEGKMLGASFSDVLNNVLGLVQYDEDTNPSESLTADELFNSYATKLCSYGTIMYRIRGTKAISASGDKCDVAKGWGVIQPDGSVLPRGDLFPSDLVLKSNRGVRLAYYADEDKDGLPNRAEYLYGCSAVDPATDQDTDNDLLDDRFEVLGVRRNSDGIAIDASGEPLLGDEVWMVQLKTGDSYEARSRCDALDSDYDGLSDYEEYERKLFKRDELTGEFELDSDGNLKLERDFADLLEVNRDSEGNVIGGGRTDPLKQDTDGDGISDSEEVRGYYVELRFPISQTTTEEKEPSSCTIPTNGNEYYVLCTSNPLSADTDGDTLNDGDEIRLAGDPTVRDNDDIGDQDFDGVANLEEAQGVEVNWELVSTALGFPGIQQSKQAISSPTSPDTDGDGLSDAQEYYSNPSTHPGKSDTDGDTVSDYDEVMGSPANPMAAGGNDVASEDSEAPGLYVTNPNDADSDDDGLSDGDELKGWSVRIVNQSRTNIYTSDPNAFDSDLDSLPDSLEKQFATNPIDPNTDGDIFELSDNDEILLGTDPLDPQDICVKFTYVETVVASDGLDVDNKGKLKGNLNLSLTTIVNGQPQEEKWVISERVVGHDSRWYETGKPVAQGFSAVRLMKYGSYARAWHNAFSYFETASYTNLPNDKDFTMNTEDFTAEKQILTGTVSSSYKEIKVNSKVTAAILNNTDIDENNLEGFCRPKNVTVPDVTNLDFTTAVSILRESQFRLGEVSRELSTTVPSGSVISQSPDAGTKKATQTSVDLVISDGAVTVPDLTGLTYFDASNLLADSGLEFGDVSPEDAADQVAARVSSQPPAAGETISDGGSINVTFTLATTDVPNLVGLSYNEAITAIENAQLELGTISPTNADTLANATVTNQSPTASSEAILGSAVNLFFQTN